VLTFSQAQIGKMVSFDPDLVPVVDDVYGSVEVWHCLDYHKAPVARSDLGLLLFRQCFSEFD
jgi:hypothetical protein